MTSLSRTERSQLCDLALRVGGDAPTLSGAWTVKDLVVHLLVREGGPSSIGITVSPLAFLTERASAKLAGHDLDELVARLRGGPPRWSPLGVRRLEEMANSVEFFVHHEDIRRAQPEWEPRTLGSAEEALLWRMVKLLGRGLARSAPVGVVLERTDVPPSSDRRAVLKKGPDPVVVRGLPSELVLYVYGRKPQALVELEGSEDAVARLQEAQ